MALGIRLPMTKHLRVAIVTALGIVLACLAVAACAPREPTMVLVVRHAERADDFDFLTVKGITRSQEIVHVAEHAGVKAIFVTEVTRTRQTAEPLSLKLGIPITTFTSTLMLGYDILAPRFDGQTVLVVAHTAGPLPAVSDVIQQLGGDPLSCVIDNEFDNLCLVIVYQREPRRAQVVNLRFAAYCAKDSIKGDCR